MLVTLGEISQLVGAELSGDPGRRISGVATLQNAGDGELSFLANRRYYSYLKNTKASAVLLSEKDKQHSPVDTLVVKDPYLSYVKILRHFHQSPEQVAGVHASAVISENANIDPSCHVGANVVIGDGVNIKENVYIGPGCVLDNHVMLGSGCRLVANVTLCHHVNLGNNVLLHPGVVIGADGFGIVEEDGRWLKIPQLGSVLLGDDVEVGANTTIDRGALEDTIIEEGVKIDNQVQIGHNVNVGAHTAIAGCAALAGSVKIGKRCRIGGGACINGHIEIADDVTITGMSGVANSIKEAGLYSGAMTTTDNRTWLKNTIRFVHLDELAKKILKLEKVIEQNDKG